MRLNGLQRIGVILSVIWFIGFAAYVRHSDRKHAADFRAMQLGVCNLVLDIANNSLSYIEDATKRENQSAANNANWDKCSEEAEKFYALQSGQNASWGQWALGVGLLIGVDLVTIGLAWLLAWLSINIVRWVRRGFSSAPS